MGEAAGKKHVLLRRTSDDGPAERSLLPDPLPHRRDLLALLCFRVRPPGQNEETNSTVNKTL